MRYLLLFALLFSCSHRPRKTFILTKEIKNPESVYFDSKLQKIYISNIDGDNAKKDKKGHISLYSADGKMINTHWIKGLNAPKGMRSFKGKLWVSDIDRVYKIDQKTAKIELAFTIPQAKFLNDIAIDSNGGVYVSDTLTSKIHLIKNNRAITFVVGNEYESPNGLLIKDDQLFVASWGLTKDWSTIKVGRLYSINLKTKKITYITQEPLGNLDGLEMKNNGNFLVSDWSAGKIYEIDPQGRIQTLFKGNQGIADIGYDAKEDRIFVPYMLDNKVFEL